MGTVPKILKKKARAEAKVAQKQSQKQHIRSLKDALKQGKKQTSPAPGKPKGVSVGASGGSSGDMGVGGAVGRGEGGVGGGEGGGGGGGGGFQKGGPKGDKTGKPTGKPTGPKQAFMSKKFKTGSGQAAYPRPGDNKTATQTKAPKDYRSSKPNFQLVENLKPIWNKVRDGSTAKNVRTELVERLVKQMKGKVLQVALRHDASRVVQCIFQFGSVQQRKSTLDELAQKVVEISKTPYGHFCVLKAIAYCTEDDEKSKIVASFKGSFRSICRNVIGARAVESLLQLYSPSLVKDLRAEFYGQKFTILLKEQPKCLGDLLAGTPAEKRSSVLDHMRDLVSNFVEKGLLEFTYVHEIMWEYVKEAAGDKARMSDLVNQLTDSAPKLMSTKPGTRVVCHVMSWANAKDRKRLMKSLKGKVLESLLHDAAHLAVMRLVDVTDDTVNVQKMMLDELKDTKPVLKYTADGTLVGTPYPPLVQVAKHRFGCKLLYRLLAPQVQHLEPDEAPLFVTSQEQSLKAPALKRSEHLAYLRAPLVFVTARYARDLLRCRSGSRVLRHVVEVFCPRAVIDAIVGAFSGAAEAPAGPEEIEGVGGRGRAEDEDDDEDDDDDDDSGDSDGEEEQGGKKKPSAAHAKKRGRDSDEEDEAGEKGADGSDRDSDWGNDEDLEDDDVAPPTDKSTAAAAAAAAAAAGSSSQPPAPPAVPLYEDPVAHLALKQLLQLESAAELSAEDPRGSKVDSSLWGGETRPQFALPLISALTKGGGDACTLQDWLLCNRGCFALLAMLDVPSAKESLLAALQGGACSGALAKASAKTQGGKQLLDKVQGVESTNGEAGGGGKGKANAKDSTTKQVGGEVASGQSAKQLKKKK